FDIIERITGHPFPCAIYTKNACLGIENEHEARDGIENRRDEIPLRLQQRRLPLPFAALFEHLDESPHLGLQNIRRERLEDVIDATKRVALADVDIALADGCKKDDGRVTGFFPLPDQGCGLKAIYIGHFDIQQDDRNLVPQQILQRLGTRTCLHEILVQALEYAFQREQILAAIIDKKDVDLFGGRHYVRA